LLLAYNRHAIADYSKTDFDEVQLSDRQVLSKGSGSPFTGTLQVRNGDIATLGAAIFADTPAEAWIDADPDGLILELAVAEGQLSGAAVLYANLRSEVIGELKSGLRFTLARWFSPRQKVATANFVAGQLEGRSVLWRPVGEGLDLRKYVEADFKGNRMHGSVRRFHDNGRVRSEMRFSNGAPVGAQKEFYRGGELEEEIETNGSNREIKAYFRNGQLRSHDNYEAGELRSAKSWYPDGSQRSIATFQYDFPESEKRWYSNGQLAYELTESGPIEHPASGLIREYHESGELKSEHNFVDGVLDGSFKVYYASGKLWEEGAYADGSLKGEHRKWWKNGTLALQASYQLGEKHGSYERWYASGKLWEKAEYDQGRLVGPYLKRWKNGKLAHEYRYEKGRPEGPYATFYDNGQSRLQATYKDGKLHGEYKNWLKDGSVYEIATYESGTKVKTTLQQ
jgi:antitoxin component YwqK of YwqJK toxin-antitoxin module